MNRLVLCIVGVIACIAACQALPEPDRLGGRIVNGEPTTIEAYPYQVSIQRTNGFHFCGGSLIKDNIVLTAAHCMQKYKAGEMQVRLGSTNSDKDGEVVSVESFKFHEDYDSSLMINDVALIKLSSPVRMTAKVRTIDLAKDTPKTGTPAVVTGWGTTCFLFCSSPKILQMVDVSVLQIEDCRKEPYAYGEESILETMVCANGEKKDACQGDSGGPLVANGVQIGVVSWGNGCAWSSYPGVYADVASLRSWIEKNSAEL
ncbi:trypsin [Drosophila grimshawi]|uniref:GH10777 n=1 Tax=Drosophila grimshawi TaxID=7222 RepID=B4JBA6_DROGR|nr:trypsin [Drosophila grimshawi]EDW02911.1 GH10777 [Drosophila grimshawi]